MRSLRAVVAALVLGLVCCAAVAQPAVRVGSKNFTEQFVLAELYAQALEAAGIKVERKINLGGTLIAHKALEEKQIDLYPEYTGTILLGTRIAVLREGRLLQYDTPARLLAQPVDAFVESFVGGDRALKRLALLTAGAHAQPIATPPDARRIGGEATLHEALAALLERDGRPLAVVDTQGNVQGGLTLESIRAALAAP
jgi:hypothetical protein